MNFMHIRRCLFIALFLAALVVPLAKAHAESIDPQYIFVRIANWNGYNYQDINSTSFSQIVNKVGSKGSGQRKLGVGLILSINSVPIYNNQQSLSNLLKEAQNNDIPVFISFDGYVWLDGRPDLWDWWSYTQGYSPNNINNVEWTCWEPRCAIKKSWRNWGSELEIKPAPNMASPALIDATKTSLNSLLPNILLPWYRNLPANQKYLLGGISLGTEVDIGGNYYYFPNGVNNGKGLPGSVQIGYNAVKTLGRKTNGTITTADLNDVIRNYLTELNRHAYTLGVPREKIFNHIGGKGFAPFIQYPPNVAFIDSNVSAANNPALNLYAQPGWSFYGDVTANPAKTTGKKNNKKKVYPALDATLDQIGSTPWAVPEWLTFAQDKNGWLASLRGTLNYRNNKFLNVANWEGIQDKPNAISAIRTVLNENICWVAAPTVHVSVNGNTAMFTWDKGANNGSLYLNISTSNAPTIAGTLANVNVANSNITREASYTRENLSSGSYYWIVAADGCGNQRKITSGSFQISGSFGSYITPTPIPTIFNPTSTPTNAPLAGDFNGDGHVNDADFNKVKNNYGNPFTIFDYNAVVTNYGR